MAGLRLDNLSKTFGAGVEAVRGVSLDIADGEFVVFVGPSGCGKTTTLRLVAGFLEPDAGVFSVPSKVLSYLCAGRPLLASVPTTNLAARIIRRNRSGIVVEPHDVEGFVSAAARLLERPSLRAGLGRRARQYAETTFDIRRIGDRFEGLFEELISS